MGGGIDIPLLHSIAFRPVQVDYVLTRFGNGFTSGNQSQSNFHYQAVFFNKMLNVRRTQVNWRSDFPDAQVNHFHAH